MKKKFLTLENKKKLENFLTKYLKEVLAEEETVTDFKKAYEEAYRVEIFGGRHFLTAELVSNWLKGLPIGIEYMTYNIVCMFLKIITGSDDYMQLENYLEDAYDLDCYYWETLGKIILRKATK